MNKSIEPPFGQNDTVTLLGVRFHKLSRSQLLQSIKQSIQKQNKSVIAHVNIHAMNVAYQLDWYRDFLNQADIVFCDGFGVVMAAKLTGKSIKAEHRVTYADWTWELAEFAEQHGFTFFLLGAKPGIVDKSAMRLIERYPNVRIGGTHHGYFNKTPGNPENEAVIEKINAVKPNILIVGFGMPLQEKWLKENWLKIDANVFLTGGAVFDYISGKLQRGPKWITDNGFEWLARLIIEPRRLWYRYLVGNPLFLFHVIKYHWLKLP